MEKYSSSEKGLLISAILFMIVGIIISVYMLITSLGLINDESGMLLIDWCGVFLSIAIFVLSIAIRYLFEVIVEISTRIKKL